jgi:hypothetical protein
VAEVVRSTEYGVIAGYRFSLMQSIAGQGDMLTQNRFCLRNSPASNQDKGKMIDQGDRLHFAFYILHFTFCN